MKNYKDLEKDYVKNKISILNIPWNYHVYNPNGKFVKTFSNERLALDYCTKKPNWMTGNSYYYSRAEEAKEVKY